MWSRPRAPLLRVEIEESHSVPAGLAPLRRGLLRDERTDSIPRLPHACNVGPVDRCAVAAADDEAHLRFRFSGGRIDGGRRRRDVGLARRALLAPRVADGGRLAATRGRRRTRDVFAHHDRLAGSAADQAIPSRTPPPQ